VIKNFAMSMIGVTAVLFASGVAAQNFAIEETTIAGIQQALQIKTATCRQIVQAYLDRIAAYDPLHGRGGEAFLLRTTATNLSMRVLCRSRYTTSAREQIGRISDAGRKAPLTVLI
jgi:hypothetical protein